MNCMNNDKLQNEHFLKHSSGWNEQQEQQEQ